ncbi:MAG: hypothetical protein KatS3mg051_1838 [Anaerolineae bacterium]|nr:MAG: hypothetical protein KatS3mg051_1838 [Anaerolineae bacterium]
MYDIDDLEALLEQALEEGCIETEDGCVVELDGRCPHGYWSPVIDLI